MKNALVGMAISVSSLAVAGSLDTPAVAQRTIRTEILRGAKAGFDCMLNTAGYGSVAVSGCVNRAYDEEVQHNNLTDAYALGLFYRTWFSLQLQVSAGIGSPEFAQSYYIKFTGHQKTLGINDLDLCDAAEVACSNAQASLAKARHGQK